MSLSQLKKNIVARLDGECVGFSVAIFKGTSLVEHAEGGHAIVGGFAGTQSFGGLNLPVPPVDVPQSHKKRMATMSTSKTITAAAVMRVLYEICKHEPDVVKAIDAELDKPIAPLLPHDWRGFAAAQTVTMRELLTHKSLLDSSGSDPDSFDSLKKTLKRGKVLKSPEYRNCNFCLFRVMLPYLRWTRIAGMSSDALKVEEQLMGSSLPAMLGANYVSAVQHFVLEPSGVLGADVVPTRDFPYTRYYDFADFKAGHAGPGLADPVDGSAVLHCGAGYWNVSAFEYGLFLGALRSGKLFPKEVWRSMRDAQLGMYHVSSKPQLWSHNGAWGDDIGCRAAWSHNQDDDSHAVVLVNSTLSDKLKSAPVNGDLTQLLTQAYRDA